MNPIYIEPPAVTKGADNNFYKVVCPQQNHQSWITFLDINTFKMLQNSMGGLHKMLEKGCTE